MAAEAEGHQRDQEASERPACGLLRMDERLWLTAAVEVELEEEEGDSKSDRLEAELERPSEIGSRGRGRGRPSVAVRSGYLPGWEGGASIAAEARRGRDIGETLLPESESKKLGNGGERVVDPIAIWFDI